MSTDSPPLLFQVTPLGLRPANDEATNACKTLKGEVEISIRRATPNNRRMRKYWKVAETVALNWPMAEGQMTKRYLHEKTLEKLGYTTEAGRTVKGEIVLDSASISFSKMDEATRSQYINDAFEFWAMALGVTKDELVEWKEIAA